MSSPGQEAGDVADLTISQLRLVELLTWGTLVAIIRTIVLYITFALPIIIGILVTIAFLFIQAEYPTITEDIANSPLLNEIATSAINVVIVTIDGVFRIIDFFIEAWDFFVNIIYLVGEKLYDALEDLLQVLFGTPKLQCILADLFDLAANLVGQILIGIKLVLESTQRTLKVVDETVPPIPSESAPPSVNKLFCAQTFPSLTSLDVSSNRQTRVMQDADPKNITPATIDHLTHAGFCSPQGGVNPDFDGGEKGHEPNGQCPPSPLNVDILKFSQVIIQIVVDVLEAVIPIAIVLIKDAFQEIAIVLPQFINLISQIINELKEHGVFTSLIALAKSIALQIYPVWNFFCPVFALFGWFLCSVFGFLSQILHSLVGLFICAFDGQSGANAQMSAPTLPAPIEASLFNNQTFDTVGATRSGRAFVLTLNRPSDVNLTQSSGFYFVPPSGELYPQSIRLDYNAVFNVPANGTVFNETAYAEYANQLAYLWQSYRASIMCGIDGRHNCQDFTSVQASVTSDYSVLDMYDYENDTLASATYLASSSSKCDKTDFVYGIYPNRTTFGPCNYNKNTANGASDNCNCKMYCNPNIMTNSGLPSEEALKKIDDTKDYNQSYSCVNPSGQCSRLPGQLCPTSLNNGQTINPSCKPCTGSDTGCNIPSPCYNTLNQPAIIAASGGNPKKFTCKCDGSDYCGGDNFDMQSLFHQTGTESGPASACHTTQGPVLGLFSEHVPIPNLNGPPTCSAPRWVFDVQQMQCICSYGPGTVPCYWGGYFCINWSISQTVFNTPVTPPTDVTCVNGKDSNEIIKFVKNLFDCFGTDVTTLLFGGDDDDGDNVCGGPLNPSSMADDGDLQRILGLNATTAPQIFSQPGDTPANNFPNSSTFLAPAVGTGTDAGYCPSGQVEGTDSCQYPPGINQSAFKCNTSNTQSAQGGSNNQADPSVTGVGGGATGTRCKAILQMCSCLKPLNSNNASDPLFAVAKCELQVLENIAKNAANIAKNVFNVVVTLFRALPSVVKSILDFIEELALDGLQWLEEFAKQAGVIFTTLQNTATLSGGIKTQMQKLEQSDVYKQFLNTSAGKMLSQLSTKKINPNATCDAACLNGSRAGSYCILNCPRTQCFLSGSPSLCCFPGPAPATLGRATQQSGVNLAGVVDATTGATLSETMSSARKFCVLGSTAADANFSDVTMTFANWTRTVPVGGRYTARMLQQMIAIVKNKQFSQLLNQSDLFDAIEQLQNIYDIMTGATQIYTPMRDDVESMRLRNDYDRNGDYQYVYDPLGIRSHFGQTVGGLIGGMVQARWASYTQEAERVRAARDAVNVDLSDAGAPGAPTSGGRPSDCPMEGTNLTSYCERAGTRDPCCRCMVINGQCRASVKSPYCCCSKNSSAYECCKGLPGCIPPIFKNIRLSRIANVDFLKYVNRQTCEPFNTGYKEVLFLVRVVMGDFVHAFIKSADTEAQRNFYQFFLGWLEFPDDNSLPAFAYLCFVLNLGRFFALLLILFLAGLLYIGFAPLVNELWEALTEEFEELQIIAGQAANSGGGGMGGMVMQQSQQISPTS